MITHPQATRIVLPDTATLPDGSAGILVDIAPARRDPAPQIGVDGEPVLYGFGRGLIPVSPGWHVVEAQSARPAGTIGVTVAAGEVVHVIYEQAQFRTADAHTPRPPRGRWLRLAATVSVRVLPVMGGLALTAWLLGWAGAPSYAGFVLSYLVGIPAAIWAILSSARAQDASDSARRVKPSKTAPRRGAQRLPDERIAPTPPPGRGAVLLDLGFWASERDAAGMDAGAVFDKWIEPPKVRIDGRTVSAGWERCWYPLNPGPHDVEILTPVAARTRVEITAGATARLTYDARFTIGADGTAKLSAARPR